MKVTTLLKSWCHDNAGLSADESADADYTKAAATALVEGSLSPEKFAELTKDPDADKALSLESKLDAVLAKLAATPETKEPESSTTKVAEGAAKMPSIGSSLASSKEEPSDGPKVNVMTMDKMYDTTRREARYPEMTESGRRHWNAGQRVFEGGGIKGAGRPMSEPSDFDLAISGAHFKRMIAVAFGSKQKVPRPLQMTEHDDKLWEYAVRELNWGGVFDGVGDEDPGAVGIDNQKLSGMQQKALLDDALSSGLELAPIVFDDAVILAPLLMGEFFPRVNVVNVTRGRRIEGASIATVTLQSAGADGTLIDLFDTSSFITEFNTTIFVVDGAIEIGLDFLSDSPINVGSILTQQYGEVLMQWLDDQVNLGDGTTEPEGVFNAGGTTTITSANGGAGPPTVGDYELLLFGIAKQFKQRFQTNRITYGASDTTYERARAIAVDATDARRVFGMDHESYMLFGHPYGIGNPTPWANTRINFVNWGRYRMYRRLGLSITVTTEGQTLVRNNLMMISARARYGGRLEDGGAAAVMTSAQT